MHLHYEAPFMKACNTHSCKHKFVISVMHQFKIYCQLMHLNAVKLTGITPLMASPKMIYKDISICTIPLKVYSSLNK